MCGILALLSKKEINKDDTFFNLETLENMLSNRGPDSCFHDISLLPIYSENCCYLYTSGYILSLRRRVITPPVAGDNIIFLYNGEIYDGLNLNDNESDTDKLYEEINRGFDGTFESLYKILHPLNGEYAFIFYHKQSNSLWFGRDAIGRRSLVVNFPITQSELIEADAIIVSSVACRENGATWTEVPAGYIYSVSAIQPQDKLDTNSILFKLNKSCFPLQNKINVCLNQILKDESTLVGEFLKYLEKSIELRIAPHTLVNNTTYSHNVHSHDRIAVMFSGGIDCTTLCAVAQKYLPESSTIELLNVAFYKQGYDSDNSPDRISARRSHADLCDKFPNIYWVLIEINVSEGEIEVSRNERIKHLIYPLNTVLDDSLGCSLWFVSRGKGSAYNIINGKRVMLSQVYKSDCKILFSGLGADELLGGYSKYYNINKSGLDAIEKEMKRDIDRLHSRNLGRDDRCCSDHGREVRYPYLDECFINFCQMIPTQYKCDFSLPKGIGDKKILRKAAKYLGLSDEVCFNKKTALQFGSQFVKVSGKEISASDVSSKLLV